MPEANPAHPTPAAALPMLVVGLAVLAILLARGVLRESAFRDSPRRTGNFGLGDIVIGIGLTVLAQAAMGMLTTSLGLAPADRNALTAREMLVALVGTQVAMAVPVLYVLYRAATALRGGLEAFGVTPRHVAAGVAPGALGFVTIMPLLMGLSAVISALLHYLGRTPPTIAHDALRMILEEPAGPVRIGLVASAVLLAPLMEELLFRGMIQTGLQADGLVRSRWLSIVIASAIFAPTHAGITSVEAMPTLFVLSLGLGYVYEKSGSLWASVVMHALFNGSQVLLALAIHRYMPQAL